MAKRLYAILKYVLLNDFFKTDPTCSNTFATNTLEGVYFTARCQINYNGSIAPAIKWNGPSSYSVYQSSGDNLVWAGIDLTADRSMQGEELHGEHVCHQQWICDLVPTRTVPRMLISTVSMFRNANAPASESY